MPALLRSMALDLPVGFLHGDPFLDNILVDPQSGAVAGFVDLEDVTVGPCLFDADEGVICGDGPIPVEPNHGALMIVGLLRAVRGVTRGRRKRRVQS